LLSSILRGAFPPSFEDTINDTRVRRPSFLTYGIHPKKTTIFTGLRSRRRPKEIDLNEAQEAERKEAERALGSYKARFSSFQLQILTSS
jgi:Plant transposon protein